jgi:hypothetical protein
MAARFPFELVRFGDRASGMPLGPETWPIRSYKTYRAQHIG